MNQRVRADERVFALLFALPVVGRKRWADERINYYWD